MVDVVLIRGSSSFRLSSQNDGDLKIEGSALKVNIMASKLVYHSFPNCTRVEELRGAKACQSNVW